MKAGATGVLGGRAFWKEDFLKEGPQGREQFARGEAAGRVKQIDDIVKANARPWFTRYGLTIEKFQRIRVTEGWHFRYGGAAAGGAAAGHVEGEMY